MILSPMMMLASVQAALQVFQGADHALAQVARDRRMLFPSSPSAPYVVDDDLTPNEILQSIRHDEEGFAGWLNNNGLGDAAVRFVGDLDMGVFATLVRAYRTFEARQGEDDPLAVWMRDLKAQTTELRQWDKDDGNAPVSPVARFALVLADAAAGLIALNPGLVGVDGQGAKLIGAFAGQVAQLVPGDEKFGSRQRLGARVMGVVLKAGLSTLNDNRTLIVEDDIAAGLVDAVTAPLLKQLASVDSLADEANWENIVDSLGGPVMKSVFSVLAEHQSEFFGADFAMDELAGVLGAQVLGIIADKGVPDAFTSQGALAMFHAALAIVAQRPELVVAGNRRRDDFLKDLLTQFADVIDKHKNSVTDRALGQSLAVAALAAFRGNAPALTRLGDEPFAMVASAALDNVLKGMIAGIADGTGLAGVFGRGRTRDIVGLFLQEIARNPGLIADNDEVQSIAAAVAAAMAADSELLLSEDDWMEIVGVALSEAARNPGRLFGFSTGNPKDELGTLAITTLLDSATASLATGRQSGNLLFGETLKTAIRATLVMVAGNPSRAMLALGLDGQNNHVAGLLAQITAATSARAGNGEFIFGAREWLRIYQQLLPRLLTDTDLALANPVPVLAMGGTLTPAGRSLLDSILSG